MGTSGFFDPACDTCEALFDPLALDWVHAWWASDPALASSVPGQRLTEVPDMIGNVTPLVSDPGSGASYSIGDEMNYRPSLRVRDGEVYSTTYSALFPVPVAQPDSVVMIYNFGGGNEFANSLLEAIDGVGSSQRVGQAPGGGLAWMNVDGGATTPSNITVPEGRVIIVAHFDAADSYLWINGVKSDPVPVGPGPCPGGLIVDAGYFGYVESAVEFIGIYPGEVMADPGWLDFLAQARHDYDISF